MDARQIIDYAADNNAKDFRESLYASIYDKVNAHIENMKQSVAQNLVTQEEKEDGDECVDKDDVKKTAKKEVKKHEDEMHEELSHYSLEEIEEYMQTEEYEQLDELSKQTLKSYKKKARADKEGHDETWINTPMGATGDEEDQASAAFRKSEQRKKGIKLAKAKLSAVKIKANEDVEQIDELSIQTMKSAKDKLAGKAIAAHYDDNKVAARNLANRALKIGKKVDRKEWQQTNQKRLDQTAKYQNEEYEEIEESVSRKHFQMVADLIKSHEDPAKRKELAQHHAEIFKQQNPRFDHAKFMKAAGASE